MAAAARCQLIRVQRQQARDPVTPRPWRRTSAGVARRAAPRRARRRPARRGAATPGAGMGASRVVGGKGRRSHAGGSRHAG
jgi:hypothetical protein